VKPVLVEYMCGPGGDGWTTMWYCEPPDLSVPFTVVRDEWAGENYGVRKIFEIKLAESEDG
jgi:hypothetical protein